MRFLPALENRLFLPKIIVGGFAFQIGRNSETVAAIKGKMNTQEKLGRLGWIMTMYLNV